MPTATSTRTVTVALVGNPNTGKSTLFNALAGVRQRVGNYPGVTVEKKLGHFFAGETRVELLDLPGTYSLAPRSPDEMVTVDVLLARRADTVPPDMVLCIVDASNLERNLYLVSQVLDLGLPTVVALNMADLARDRGIQIDVPALAARLGVPVLEIQANRKVGLPALRAQLVSPSVPPTAVNDPFPALFREEVRSLHARWFAAPDHGEALPAFLVQRLLLDTNGYLDKLLGLPFNAARDDDLSAARERLAAGGWPLPAAEAMARYGWIGERLSGIVQKRADHPVSWSDRLDRLLTQRVWGSLIFVLLMLVVFQAVFRWAEPLMGWVDQGTTAVGDAVAAALPEGALRSLLVDGLIAGVGGVLVFLPQILILFLFIGILEDCGYMARAAYLMDKLMVRVGLSGKSFIPLLSSFACAVPGIMATRVIENRRDRLTTMLIAPLMSCSARLPVYTLLIAAFVPPSTYLGGVVSLPGLVMLSMYFLGMVVAAGVALVLKRTLLKGPTPAFVMELPPYKLPSWSMLEQVVRRMLERGWSFVRRAGTLVVAVSVLVWAGLYYPHDVAEVEGPFASERAELAGRLASASPEQAEQIAAEQAALEREVQGTYNRQSYLGRMGRAIEPAVRPLGWDWRIGCAVLASFPAREVVVATLGVIYDQGEVDLEDAEQAGALTTALRDARWDDTGERVFNLPVALSLMVFFALCAQCASTLVVLKRESGSWRWPVFTFVYMTTLAYLGAWITYRVGMALAG